MNHNHDKKITGYAIDFTSDEPKIVQHLVRSTQEHLAFTDTISGKQVGWILKFLVRSVHAKRILEVGTFTGYSALMMASEMGDEGELITLERNPGFQKISASYFNTPPYNRRITQVIGDALEILPTLTGEFDLIFLDADKINYPSYFPLLIQKLTGNGILVIDNVLWRGGVAEPENKKAEAIHTMNVMIRENPRVEQVMLPVRDGITMVRLV